MKAPVLNRLALFERPSGAQEAVYGTMQAGWTPIAYLPGSPAVAEKFRVEIQDEMPSRSERVQAGLSVAANRSRLRMRWRDDVDSTQRVTVYGDTNMVYQIIAGPAEVGGGRKRYIELVLERYTTQGDAL